MRIEGAMECDAVERKRDECPPSDESDLSTCSRMAGTPSFLRVAVTSGVETWVLRYGILVKLRA